MREIGTVCKVRNVAAAGPSGIGEDAAVRPAAAATVVFIAAAAVLLLEILAVRLMAPYVGVSLNTYTGVIGTVLAGISAGAFVGGWSADRIEPGKLLGPILIAGGVLALATAPLTTALGEGLQSDSLKAIIALSAATVFLPAFVLSGVTPIVVKMQLRNLDVTGSVVGRMSAFGTAGALVGTFGTGFFLTAHFPSRAILAGVGGILIAAGALLSWRLVGGASPLAIVACLVATAAAGVAAATVRGPCKVESAYSCIRVVKFGGDQRELILDNLTNSYVDIPNPTDLILPYSQVVGAVVDTLGRPRSPIRALQIGAGAFTLPRYITATRPGSLNTVMEIDPAVVDTAHRDFGVPSGPDLRVEEGDARLLIGKEPPRSQDIVIGDAFSGRSVPWQLTTKEFLGEVDRVLLPNGVYVMNLIDGGDRFLRAEAATMRSVFPFVALLQIRGAHNHILVAANHPIGLSPVATRVTEQSTPVTVIGGDQLDGLIGGARILEDDFAPVDQLIQ